MPPFLHQLSVCSQCLEQGRIILIIIKSYRCHKSSSDLPYTKWFISMYDFTTQPQYTQFSEDSDTFWMTDGSNTWVFKYRKSLTSPTSKQECYNNPNLQNSIDTSCLTSSHYLLMLCSSSFSQACHPFRSPFLNLISFSWVLKSWMPYLFYERRQWAEFPGAEQRGEGCFTHSCHSASSQKAWNCYKSSKQDSK